MYELEWRYPIGSVVQRNGQEHAVIAHGVQWNPLLHGCEPIYQVTQQFTMPNPANAGWVSEDRLEPIDV